MKKVLRALLILAGVTLLVAPFGNSTPEYSKKENKQCVYCHTTMGSKELNDAGKWYKEHDHSLKGYVEKKKP